MKRPRRDAVTRALLLCLVLAVTLLGAASHAAQPGASLDKATRLQKAQAGEAYRKGMDALKKEDREAALKEFEKSYGIVASPNSHLMITRTLADMERWTEAHREAELTLREAQEAAKLDSKYEETATAAQGEVDRALAKLCTVTIKVSGLKEGEDAKLVLSGKVIPREQWGQPQSVPPGVHVVILETTTHSESREVSVFIGEPAVVEISPAQPKPKAPPPKPKAPPSERPFFDLENDKQLYGVIAAGVGGVGLLTFAIFGAATSAKYSELESDCPNNVCPPDYDGDISAGQAFQTVANIGAVVGALGLTAGVSLFIWGKSDSVAEQSEEIPAKGPAPEPSAKLLFGPGSAFVSGTF